MFLVGELGATINADQGPFNKTLDSVFRDGGRKMQDLGKTMTAALTAPLVGAGGMAVKTAADYEQLEVQLSNLVGSAEEGARIFKQLQDFSAGTPFEQEEIIKANNTLIGMGMAADEAFESLEMLGNVSSATGANLGELSRVFGESRAEGKLLTRDIRQFVNQGVPAVDMLADSLGVAQGEVFDLAEQGQISFDDLQKAFTDVAGEGGRWADATEDQANTISGLFSTLKDNVNIALADLGEVIVDTFDLKEVTRDLTASISNIVDRFKDLSDDSQQQIIKMAGMLAVGGPLMIAIGKAGQIIAGFAKLVRSQFAIITASFATGVGIGQWFVDNWNSMFGDAEADFTSFTDSTVRGMKKIIDPIVNFAEEAMGGSGALEDFFSLFEENDAMDKSADEAQESADKINKSLSGLQSFDIDGIEKTATDIENLSSTLDEGVGEGLSDMRASMDPALEGLSMVEIAIRNADDSITEAEQAGADFGATMGDALSQAALHGEGLLDIAKNLVKQFASRALVTGLSALFSGGASLGGKSFLSAVFGGFRSNGGPMEAGKGYRVFDTSRGEVFFPGTNGSMVPMGAGGGGSSSVDMQKAFEKALSAHTKKLGPQEVFALSQQGKYEY